MKKGIIAAYFAAVALLASAHDDIAVVEGSGAGLPDGVVVNLFRSEGPMGTLAASDTIAGGRFRMEVEVDSGLTRSDLLILSPGFFPSIGRPIYLRPGAKVKIDAPDNLIQTWNVSSNVTEQALNDFYLMGCKDLNDKYQQCMIDFDRKLEAASDETTRDSLIQAYRNDAPSRDSIMIAIGHRTIDLMKSRPVDNIWLETMEDLCRYSDEYNKYPNNYHPRLKAMYESLDKDVRESEEGSRIHMLLYPPKVLQAGDTLPDRLFHDLDGNEHHLSELHGKWLLLDFWSRGCYACVMAIPELSALAEKYPSTAAVVSLSVDNDKMWRDASASHKIFWNNWNEGKEDFGMYRDFGAKALPTFALVSPEGVIIKIFYGFSQGLFVRLMDQYTVPRPAPAIRAKDGGTTICVTNPSWSENNTDAILDIERSETSPAGTTLYFKIRYTPGWWIRLSPDAYLSDSDGRKYALKSSDGIVAGEKFYADDNGSGSFSLTFEPVPSDKDTIDFSEGTSGSWAIKGITIR